MARTDKLDIPYVKGFAFRGKRVTNPLLLRLLLYIGNFLWLLIIALTPVLLLCHIMLRLGGMKGIYAPPTIYLFTRESFQMRKN